MRTFVAMMGKQRFFGGWYHCVHWGMGQVTNDHSLVVKVIAIRPGEKRGRVVSEVTSEGIRQIEKGRLFPAHKLRNTS